MKKHFIYTLILFIILSNCFPTAIFAQEIGSPSGGKEIFAEAPDVVIEEADVPNADSEAILASEEIADSEELTGQGCSCGKNATWSISGNILTISGSGAIYGYDTMASPWYELRSSIQAIFVEDGITEIGTSAFFEMVNVTGVSLPSSLKRIDRMAFYRCRNLPSIEIPAGVTNIGEQAFAMCPKLAFVTFLGAAPQILSNAFANVTADVFYPTAYTSWSPNTLLQYSGTLNWVSVSKYYNVWVYGVRVNSANKNNILHTNESVKYNSSTKTLELPRMEEMPTGLAISRDFYKICAPVYAIGDLNLETTAYLNMVNTNVSIYVTGNLTIYDSDARMNGIYSGQFTVKDSRISFEGISSGNIDMVNGEYYAAGLNSQDHIVIKQSSIHIAEDNAFNLMTCYTCDIQDSTVTLQNEEGTCIRCYSQFAVGGSYLAAWGKTAGINAPYIRILQGNEIVATGDEGGMFGLEDAMSKPMEIASGYVFIEPANPEIGSYAIKENGKNSTYVYIRELKPEDKAGLRRGKTAVSNITVSTRSLTQLEMRTKDNYFVTADWSSGNPGIASVDKNGLVAAYKYGKTKITCKAGSTTLTCDVQVRFSDVQNTGHAYFNAIYWAADKGITKGYPDGTFGIESPCTRGEMMMFLWRYANMPAPKAATKSPFKDVPANHTFYKAILWGSQKGITKGYADGTFGIDRKVTRGEAMMFLWRLKGKPAPVAAANSPFSDVPKNHAFYNAILWGSQKKVTTGYTSGPNNGKFMINDNCTRGQIVTFLYRAR